MAHTASNHPPRRLRRGARPTEPLHFEDNSERDHLLEALAQIERLAREGTREGHLIRDAMQEIASKALEPHRVAGVIA